jgi:hypothetical protein
LFPRGVNIEKRPNKSDAANIAEQFETLSSVSSCGNGTSWNSAPRNIHGFNPGLVIAVFLFAEAVGVGGCVLCG